MDVTTLQCSGTIVWMNERKHHIRRVDFKTMTVKLLRNEFRDLILNVDVGKNVHKFPIVNVKIYKKFVTEGKAAIEFDDSHVLINFSNAPTANLIPFLKTLFIKISSKKQSPKVKLREQLLSGKPHSLEDISPVNTKDVHRLRTEIIQKEKNLTAEEMRKKRLREQRTDKEVSVFSVLLFRY